MLDVALQFLTDELNSYLLARTGSDSVAVKLTRVVDEAGKYAVEEGSLGATIINIEEERAFRAQLPDYNFKNGQHEVLEPALKLNLHVLFSANLKLYDQSLKYLAHILTYFQARTVFTAEGYPALDSRIERLTVELQSLSYEQLNQVWAFVGGKQLPSAIYKVRMISLQDVSQTTIQPPLTSINANFHTK